MGEGVRGGVLALVPFALGWLYMCAFVFMFVFVFKRVLLSAGMVIVGG